MTDEDLALASASRFTKEQPLVVSKRMYDLLPKSFDHLKEEERLICSKPMPISSFIPPQWKGIKPHN